MQYFAELGQIVSAEVDVLGSCCRQLADGFDEFLFFVHVFFGLACVAH